MGSILENQSLLQIIVGYLPAKDTLKLSHTRKSIRQELSCANFAHYWLSGCYSETAGQIDWWKKVDVEKAELLSLEEFEVFDDSWLSAYVFILKKSVEATTTWNVGPKSPEELKFSGDVQFKKKDTPLLDNCVRRAAFRWQDWHGNLFDENNLSGIRSISVYEDLNLKSEIQKKEDYEKRFGGDKDSFFQTWKAACFASMGFDRVPPPKAASYGNPEYDMKFQPIPCLAEIEEIEMNDVIMERKFSEAFELPMTLPVLTSTFSLKDEEYWDLSSYQRFAVGCRLIFWESLLEQREFLDCTTLRQGAPVKPISFLRVVKHLFRKISTEIARCNSEYVSMGQVPLAAVEELESAEKQARPVVQNISLQEILEKKLLKKFEDVPMSVWLPRQGDEARGTLQLKPPTGLLDVTTDFQTTCNELYGVMIEDSPKLFIPKMEDEAVHHYSTFVLLEEVEKIREILLALHPEPLYCDKVLDVALCLHNNQSHNAAQGDGSYMNSLVIVKGKAILFRAHLNSEY